MKGITLAISSLVLGFVASAPQSENAEGRFQELLQANNLPEK